MCVQVPLGDSRIRAARSNIAFRNRGVSPHWCVTFIHCCCVTKLCVALEVAIAVLCVAQKSFLVFLKENALLLFLLFLSGP